MRSQTPPSCSAVRNAPVVGTSHMQSPGTDRNAPSPPMYIPEMMSSRWMRSSQASLAGASWGSDSSPSCFRRGN